MRVLVAIATVLIFSTNVFAGILFEPYAGTESGTFKGTVGGLAAYKIAGSQFGAKVGYGVMGLGFGVDYATANLKATDTTTALVDVDLKATDLGVFAEYRFPVYIKVSATYFMDAKITSEALGNKMDYKGKGTKVGIGFTGIPFFAINLDVLSEKYDDIQSGGATLSTVTMDRASVFLSISAPFKF